MLGPMTLGALRSGGAGNGNGFTGAYDDIPNIVAAYGMRRLLSSYTGNLLRIRRSSDNAEQDFGYDDNGDLDTAAIATFIGAGSGFVVTWYDQSGGAHNATQATALQQPLYVASDQNSKPVTSFDDTGDRLGALDVFGGATLGNLSMIAVYSAASSSDTRRAYGFGARSIDGYTSSKIHLNPATENSLRFEGANITGSIAHPANFFVRVTTKNNTTYHDYTNGSTNINGGSVTDGGIVDDFYMGYLNNPTICKISEIVVSSSVWSTGDRQAAESAAASYWGITLP